MESYSSTLDLLPDQFSGVLDGRQRVRELVSHLHTTVPIVSKCKKIPLTMPTGSPAAALMASFGVVPGEGAYVCLQSSAKGGDGSPLVQGVTRAESGVFGVSQFLDSYLYGREPSKLDDAAAVGEMPQEERVEADEPAELKAKL